METRNIQQRPPALSGEENLARLVDRKKRTLEGIKDDSVRELQEKVRRELDDFNKKLEITLKDLHFKLHEDSERYFVQVVDRNTDEIIKELPPQEMLDLLVRVQRMVGLFLDEIV